MWNIELSIVKLTERQKQKKNLQIKKIQAVNLVSELFTQICNHGLEVILDRGSWVKKKM